MSAEKFIYFMKPVGMAGPIKIGFSEKPVKRLLSVAAWSPVPLEIIATAPGSRLIERQIHNCFADIHSHGEWFHPHERLLKAIKAVMGGANIADAIDLTDTRGNLLAEAQMKTRVKNGTVGRTRWNRPAAVEEAPMTTHPIKPPPAAGEGSMTIEVVVKGDKRPEDRIYRNRCNHCNSLLQFKASDGRFVEDRCDGDAIVIKCPECKSDVWTAVDAYQKDWTDAQIKALARRMGA